MKQIDLVFLWAAGETTPGAGLGFFNLAAVLIALTALFAYLNHRFVRLPPSIGVMALALAFSLAVDRRRPVRPRRRAGRRQGWSARSTSTRRCCTACSASCSSPARCTSTWATWPAARPLIAVLATLGVAAHHR